MYSKITNLVFGFHGCDKSVVERIIHGEEMKPSNKEYDWLGHGVYFWENDPQRAYEWALEASNRKNSSVKEPAVVGTVLDLGHCLDLTNRESIKMVQVAYQVLSEYYEDRKMELPKNENVQGNKDWVKRYLDCTVIEQIHKGTVEDVFPKFDSVKCMFTEGNQAYPGSGFREKTHTQICIVNPNCIKAVFIPREINKNYFI